MNYEELVRVAEDEFGDIVTEWHFIYRISLSEISDDPVEALREFLTFIRTRMEK